MNRKRLQAVDSPEEVPKGLSDEEQIRFWETHEVTEEFLAGAEMVSEDERPRPRTKPINVRFDDFTLGRLKALADSRNVGYQTLLKTFVQERLYEEEKREGALPTASSQGEQSSGEVAQERRDWLNRVHDYLKEHEELLEDPELTSIATSRVASDSSAMLKQLRQEIDAARRKPGDPISRLSRMEKAFHRLQPFVVRVIETYKERSELEEEDLEGDYDIDPEGDYNVIREAEQVIGNA